jgi:Tol biopolymer transport system component
MSFTGTCPAAPAPAATVDGGGEIVNRIVVLALTLTAALSLTVAAQQKPAATPQTADAALGAAMHLEEVDRNLEGAIAAYKAFLVQYGSNRPLAAKAQYRLGLAYKRLGDGQAREAFQRVITQFADQTNVVSQARYQLAAIDLPQAAGASSWRQLLTHENYNNLMRDSSVSADGRWLVTRSDRPDGNLLVHDLRSRKVRRISGGTCSDAGRLCIVEQPIWSPDGRYIAYGWYDPSANNDNAELRVIAMDPQAKPRVVLRDTTMDLWPGDWAPDGHALLVTALRPGHIVQIGWVPIAGGTFKPIKSFDNRSIDALSGFPRVSTDGRFITYGAALRPSAGDQRETQIYVISGDGSKEEARLTTEGINEQPLWSADGSYVVYTSDRKGEFGLWAIPVRAGAATGDPIPVKTDAGRVRTLAITRTGSLYYILGRGVTTDVNMFQVELNPVTNKPTSPVRYLSERFVGQNCCPSWSPDGRFVAFKRFRHSQPDVRDVVIRSLASGTERTYTASDWTNTPYGFGPGAPKWLPDSSGLFVGDEPIVGQSRWIGRMDLEGHFTKLVEIPAELGWIAALSPDMQTAYALTRKGDPTKGTYAGVAAINLNTGQYRRVFNAPDAKVYSVAVSPNGATLALLVQPDKGGRNVSALATLAPDGSNYRELYPTTAAIANVPDQVQWSADGQKLFFQENGRLMRIAAAGGSPEFLDVTRANPAESNGFRVNGDGTRVGITEGSRRPGTGELWVVDNLLTTLKPAH